MARQKKTHDPFHWFDSSPEVIRLVVMMYVRYPLSLRNVEDLLFERGIDICHETVRLWHRAEPHGAACSARFQMVRTNFREGIQQVRLRLRFVEFHLRTLLFVALVLALATSATGVSSLAEYKGLGASQPQTWPKTFRSAAILSCEFASNQRARPRADDGPRRAAAITVDLASKQRARSPAKDQAGRAFCAAALAWPGFAVVAARLSIATAVVRGAVLVMRFPIASVAMTPIIIVIVVVILALPRVLAAARLSDCRQTHQGGGRQGRNHY